MDAKKYLSIRRLRIGLALSVSRIPAGVRLFSHFPSPFLERELFAFHVELIFHLLQFPAQEDRHDCAQDNDGAQLSEIVPRWVDNALDNIFADEEFESKREMLPEMHADHVELMVVALSARQEFPERTDAPVCHDQDAHIADHRRDHDAYGIQTHDKSAGLYGFHCRGDGAIRCIIRKLQNSCKRCSSR